MPLNESDFTGVYQHPDTGLRYENFGAYFAGDTPMNTDRNASIERFQNLHYAPTAIKAFITAYDSCPGGLSFGTYNPLTPANHQDRWDAGVKAGKATGMWGPAAYNNKSIYEVLTHGAAGI